MSAEEREAADAAPAAADSGDEFLTPQQLSDLIDEQYLELGRLNETRKKEAEVYTSPEQLDRRRAVRARLLGECVLQAPLEPDLLDRVIAWAARSDEDWLFKTAPLAEDGVELASRNALRERLIGRYVLRQPLDPKFLDYLKAWAKTTEDDWLFEENALKEDGVKVKLQSNL